MDHDYWVSMSDLEGYLADHCSFQGISSADILAVVESNFDRNGARLEYKGDSHVVRAVERGKRPDDPDYKPR